MDQLKVIVTIQMILSLRQRFLVAPVIGFLLVIFLTYGFYRQSEKQNELISELSNTSLDTLNVYTRLFTDLSRYHQELYDLFNSAGQQVDEGILYDRGILIIDNILRITKQMEILISNKKGGEILSERETKTILEKIIKYRTAAISTVENTTVSLDRAPQYLSKANNNFSEIHEYFAKELDIARSRIRDRTNADLDKIHRNMVIFYSTGMVCAFLLIVFSFVSSGLLSSSLRRNIQQLFSLTRNRNYQATHSAKDEVQHLDFVVQDFRKSLELIKTQEIELRQAKETLEHRVSERTLNLSRVNEELVKEIEHREKAENKLRIYREIIQNTDEAIIITSPDARIIEANPAYERSTGYTRDELIGSKPSKMRSGKHEPEFYNDMWNAIQKNGQWSGEIWNRNKDGHILPHWIVINAIYDNDGQIQYLIGFYRDISELKQAEARLEQLAFYDPLTNLPNRTLFNEKLSQEISSLRRHGEKMALLFLDLDNFKDVNDTFGHNIGDRLLIEVGTRLQHVLRDTDFLSRLSGDEFNIAITQLKEPSCIDRVCNKIIEAIEKPYYINNETIKVGVSIGVSVYPDHSNHIETLKKYSDMAMYQAKGKGKNQFQIFTPDMQLSLEQRLDLEKALQSAVDTQAFTMHFQPIIDYQSGQIVSAEALIRWFDHGKFVPPDQFITLAEESDLIIKIDNWVLDHVCQCIIHWADHIPPEFSIHVNLSSRFFQMTDTPLVIQNVLNKYGISGHSLCLEITETAVITDATATKNNIKEIQKMGIQVALDDFGTGFSSLNYLTQFGINKIKIDKSFIDSVHVDSANQSVVNALIELSGDLDILVVAEGVELKEHDVYLKSIGCHFAQGYYYSKPVPQDEFLDKYFTQQTRTKAG